jgi:hypothetical protein
MITNLRAPRNYFTCDANAAELQPRPISVAIATTMALHRANRYELVSKSEMLFLELHSYLLKSSSPSWCNMSLDSISLHDIYFMI